MRIDALSLLVSGLAVVGSPVPGDSPRAVLPARRHGTRQVDSLNPFLDGKSLSVRAVTESDGSDTSRRSSSPATLQSRDDSSEAYEVFEPQWERPSPWDRIEFEETLVAAASGQKYKEFIESLRRRLQNEQEFSHNVPILPPQRNPPDRWFHVVITTASRSVRLRIRRDNIYIDGYQEVMEEDEGPWFEFSNLGNRHLIPGSQFLGFGGGYTALQSAAGRERHQVNLGQQALITAVNTLVATNSRSDRARSLIVISQMLSEAIRFVTILNQISNNYETGAQLPGTMTALQNGWGTISGALLEADADPAGLFRLNPSNNDMGIRDVPGAVRHLGMILATCSSVRAQSQSGSPRGKVRRGMTTATPHTLGRPLLEVFSLTIKDIDEENPGDLFGTITATDAWNTQVLYNVDRSHDQSVRPGHQVSLTGLRRPPSAADDVCINVNLGDRDMDLSPDDEVSRGQVVWDVYDPYNEYNRPKSVDIKGEYGRSTLEYVVMSHAVEALVQVMLINGDDEHPTDLYGSIWARTRFGQRHMFRKGADQSVETYPGRMVHLDRPVMAVPVDGDLTIEADVADRDSLPDISADDEVAKGEVRFEPQIYQSVHKRIRGRHGEIEVRVQWH